MLLGVATRAGLVRANGTRLSGSHGWCFSNRGPSRRDTKSKAPGEGADRGYRSHLRSTISSHRQHLKIDVARQRAARSHHLDRSRSGRGYSGFDRAGRLEDKRRSRAVEVTLAAPLRLVARKPRRVISRPVPRSPNAFEAHPVKAAALVKQGCATRYPTALLTKSREPLKAQSTQPELSPLWAVVVTS